MSKPVNKSKTYLKMAIVFSLIVGCFVGIVFWLIAESVRKEIQIPVVSDTAGDGTGYLKAGSPITANDLSTAPVSKYNLPTDIVTDPNVLIGKFVTRDYHAPEHFWGFNITDDYPKKLAERIRYGAIPVPASLIDTCGAEIMEDDFVKVDIIMSKNKDEVQDTYEITDIQGKLPDSGVTIIEADELKAMRVVGFCDANGFDITATKWNNLMTSNPNNRQQINPSFLIFDGDPIQQALLLQGMYGGKIKLIIIPEEQQEKYRLEWGLVDEDGNKIENPSFVDDSADIEQKQAQLKQSIQDAQIRQSQQIDNAINAIDSGEVSTKVVDDTSSPTDTGSSKANN